MSRNLTFGDLEPAFCNPDDARVVVYSVPFESTVSYGKGTSLAPEAILNASAQVELYDEETGKEPYQVGIHTIANYQPEDWQISSEAMVERVRSELAPFVQKDQWVLLLGGEHSVTLGAVQALSQKYPELSVLQIDAHADLRPQYQGSPFSHASIMSRVREICPSVGVGIRSLSSEEGELIRRESVPIFFAHQIRKDRLWMEHAVGRLTDTVYITIDVDGLDPSIMPATGTPEPGGLLWHEVLEFLRLVFERRKVVGADLVELAPATGQHACEFLVARLAYKLIGFQFQNQC